MTSIKPRKQRYMLYNAPLHQKRKRISSHLAENLLLKYDRRSLPVVKGDTVKIMRGSFRGHEEKIAKVNVQDQTVEVEGVTMSTAKGTKIAKPLHASKLLITKLNLTDKWRRQKLEKGLSETATKEIEKEAAEQLKEKEDREKIAAEEAAAKKAEEQLKEETEPAEATDEAADVIEETSESVEEEGAGDAVEENVEPPKKKPAAKKPAEKIAPKKKEGEEA